jgi:hypothetical protein
LRIAAAQRRLGAVAAAKSLATIAEAKSGHEQAVAVTPAKRFLSS